MKCRSEWQTPAAQVWQHRHEIVRVDAGEFGNARRSQKALEPAHAGVRQRIDFLSIAGHEAAPEFDVHARAQRRAPLPTPAIEQDNVAF